MVVGGTGIAPALQILREIVAGAEGAFAAGCAATVLYASRTPEDVLCVDELREATEIGVASTRRLLHQVSRLEGRSPSGGPWMGRLFASMVDSIAGLGDSSPSSP